MSGFPMIRAFDGRMFDYFSCARSPAGVATMTIDLTGAGYDVRTLQLRGLYGIYTRRRSS
ncbi:MAG: hypothetical protein LLG45_13195 [Actinomycetia bacterium]|nr:hypothetical protein [Actinomycetes bacterium]